MKEEFLGNLQLCLSDRIPISMISTVIEAVTITLYDYDIRKKERALVKYDDGDEKTIKKYFVSKAVEGLSPNTLRAYRCEIKKFFSLYHNPIKDITTDDIRVYLAYLKTHNCNDVTINNARRNLSSFLGWCSLEGYISSNPVLRIRAIRQPKKLKKSFSEDDMEKLRTGSANDLRLRAIVEFLYSTGCRVTEMCNANRYDINFDEGTLDVLGKGKKYRTVYISARCKIHLEAYLSSRTDSNEALFVSKQMIGGTGRRLAKGCVEKLIRDLGRQCGVEHAHPHRFRRTAATLALRRGMPIEQVQRMLGHESIATTTIYAQSTNEDVKRSHEKYII